MFLTCKASGTTAAYTLSLHDALPILRADERRAGAPGRQTRQGDCPRMPRGHGREARRSVPARHLPDRQRDLHEYERERSDRRSEEHTSELQSHSDLVCRLLLEKKKGM